MGASLFEKAYRAFHDWLPRLLAEGHLGRWVLFHGDEQVAVSDDRDQLYELARVRSYPDSDILIQCVLPEPEAIDAELFSSR